MGKRGEGWFVLQLVLFAVILLAPPVPPVTFPQWLRALARLAHAECGGPGVGAIGMCFTGNFALSLMLEPAVRAPVLSQPSLPLLQRGGMHIAPDELARVIPLVEALFGRHTSATVPAYGDGALVGDGTTVGPAGFAAWLDDGVPPAQAYTPVPVRRRAASTPPLGRVVKLEEADE